MARFSDTIKKIRQESATEISIESKNRNSNRNVSRITFLHYNKYTIHFTCRNISTYFELGVSDFSSTLDTGHENLAESKRVCEQKNGKRAVHLRAVIQVEATGLAMNAWPFKWSLRGGARRILVGSLVVKYGEKIVPSRVPRTNGLDLDKNFRRLSRSPLIKDVEINGGNFPANPRSPDRSA